MESLLGWSASTLLLATISYQSWRQYRHLCDRDGQDGASPWLFLGQAIANGLFVVYAVLLGNWVFTITNAGLLIASLFGLGICVLQHGGPTATADAGRTN